MACKHEAYKDMKHTVEASMMPMGNGCPDGELRTVDKLMAFQLDPSRR